MIRVFLLCVLVSCRALALSMPTPSEGTQGQLAAQHYQPYTGLKFYCFASLLATYEGTQEWRDRDGQKETVFPGTNISFALGTVTLAVTGLVGSHFKAGDDVKPFSPDQIDLESYNLARDTFRFGYAVTALADLAMTLSSGNENRWWFFAGGLATPFILDQIFRPLFYSDRLSPWTNPAKFQVTPALLRDATPGVSLAAWF